MELNFDGAWRWIKTRAASGATASGVAYWTEYGALIDGALDHVPTLGDLFVTL